VRLRSAGRATNIAAAASKQRTSTLPKKKHLFAPFADCRD